MNNKSTWLELSPNIVRITYPISSKVEFACNYRIKYGEAWFKIQAFTVFMKDEQIYKTYISKNY